MEEKSRLEKLLEEHPELAEEHERELTLSLLAAEVRYLMDKHGWTRSEMKRFLDL